MPAPRLPQTFGRYVLRERVGQGGMAEVFRASLPGFGGFDKQVAIKRMFREYSHDHKFIEMLTDEAKIVSQLAHPNIVQILDVGQIGNDYYIAFEYIEGVDLFRLLQRHHEVGRDLPLGMACYIVAELCSALDHAHSRRTADGTALGIVHRDVSPQNVLLSLIGEVKLTDFGIAKAAYRYTHTQAGMVKGKIYYMSPEQALGHAIDHRSDLFSAGILLYETLCTRPLYDEADQKALYDRVCAATYEWPADKMRRVPPPLMAVVEKALKPQAGNRYQTGRGFREAILSVARDLGFSCDREEFGQYLRTMYELPEDRPPAVVVQRPRITEMGQDDVRWHSTIAPMPTEDRVPERSPALRPQVRPEPARAESRPLRAPGAVEGSKPQVSARPLESPARPAEAARPRAVEPRVLEARASDPRVVETRALDARNPSVPRTLTETRPEPEARLPDAPPALPARPRPTGPAPAAARVPPRPGTPMPAVRPSQAQPQVARPTPSPSPTPAARAASQTREAVAGAPPHLAPTNPQRATKLAPAAAVEPKRPQQTPQPRHDEATSMMERAEMDRRLADARAGASTMQPAEMAQPDADASTRFIEAMPDEVEDTTKPSRTKRSQEAKAPQVEDAPLDRDDEPASWRLLAVTALVWTGVLVLGVYATLLTVTR